MNLEIKARAQGLEIKYLRKDLWELKNPESTCVQVLNKAYNKVMKEEVSPTTTKGMTYAYGLYKLNQVEDEDVIK